MAQPELIPVSLELQKKLGNVAVFYGGDSAEREVSLQSGNAILAALKKAGIDATGVDIRGNFIDQIQSISFDRVFIALHGTGGEDGRLQAVLDFLNIPYTGSGMQACVFAMDKLRSKQIWSGINLSTPEFTDLNESTDWEKVIRDLGSIMVKPAHEGSSIGMAKVESAIELENAYREAAKYDTSVLAEKVIEGAEYTVSILDGKALPAIRLETGNRFYDYEAKYLSEDTKYICPCGLPAEEEEKLAGLALAAFNSLGCKGWGRVDLMADEASNYYLLEVNTVPGMTSHSLVPMAARASGLSFEELVVKLILNTLETVE